MSLKTSDFTPVPELTSLTSLSEVSGLERASQDVNYLFCSHLCLDTM